MSVEVSRNGVECDFAPLLEPTNRDTRVSLAEGEFALSVIDEVEAIADEVEPVLGHRFDVRPVRCGDSFQSDKVDRNGGCLGMSDASA